MHMLWKRALPAAQLLIASSTFAWYSLEKSVDVSTAYAYPARDIVIKLNFPIALLWSPILYFMERFSDYLNPSSVVMKTISLVFFLVLFGLSIVLFWYFLAAEVELRIQNRSMIRFRNWFAETCKALILFAMGTGAIAYAAFEADRLLHFDRSKTDAVVGGAFLLAWGVLFITMSIRDITFFFRTRVQP